MQRCDLAKRRSGGPERGPGVRGAEQPEDAIQMVTVQAESLQAENGRPVRGCLGGQPGDDPALGVAGERVLEDRSAGPETQCRTAFTCPARSGVRCERARFCNKHPMMPGVI